MKRVIFAAILFSANYAQSMPQQQIQLPSAETLKEVLSQNMYGAFAKDGAMVTDLARKKIMLSDMLQIIGRALDTYCKEHDPYNIKRLASQKAVTQKAIARILLEKSVQTKSGLAELLKELDALDS